MLRRKQTANIAVSARTGNHASSVRTIVRKDRVLVPENSNLPYGQFQVLPYAFRGIFTLLQQEGLMVPFLHGMHQVVVDT